MHLYVDIVIDIVKDGMRLSCMLVYIGVLRCLMMPVTVTMCIFASNLEKNSSGLSAFCSGSICYRS